MSKITFEMNHLTFLQQLTDLENIATELVELYNKQLKVGGMNNVIKARVEIAQQKCKLKKELEKTPGSLYAKKN